MSDIFGGQPAGNFVTQTDFLNETGVLQAEIDTIASQSPVTLTARVVSLENSRTTDEGNIATNTSAISTLNSSLSTTNSNVTTNTSNISTLTASLGSLSSSVTNNTNSIISLGSSINTLNTQVAVIQGNQATDEANIASLLTATASNTTSISTLNTTVSTLNTNVNNLSASLTSTNSALATAQGNITTLQSQQATTTTSITSLNSSVSTLNTNLATTNSNLATVTSKQNTDENNITTLNNEMALANSTLATLQAQVYPPPASIVPITNISGISGTSVQAALQSLINTINSLSLSGGNPFNSAVTSLLQNTDIQYLTFPKLTALTNIQQTEVWAILANIDQFLSTFSPAQFLSLVLRNTSPSAATFTIKDPSNLNRIIAYNNGSLIMYGTTGSGATFNADTSGNLTISGLFQCNAINCLSSGAFGGINVNNMIVNSSATIQSLTANGNTIMNGYAIVNTTSNQQLLINDTQLTYKQVMTISNNSIAKFYIYNNGDTVSYGGFQSTSQTSNLYAYTSALGSHVGWRVDSNGDQTMYDSGTNNSIDLGPTSGIILHGYGPAGSVSGTCMIDVRAPADAENRFQVYNDGSLSCYGNTRLNSGIPSFRIDTNGTFKSNGLVQNTVVGGVHGIAGGTGTAVLIGGNNVIAGAELISNGTAQVGDVMIGDSNTILYAGFSGLGNYCLPNYPTIMNGYNNFSNAGPTGDALARGGGDIVIGINNEINISTSNYGLFGVDFGDQQRLVYGNDNSVKGYGTVCIGMKNTVGNLVNSVVDGAQITCSIIGRNWNLTSSNTNFAGFNKNYLFIGDPTVPFGDLPTSIVLGSFLPVKSSNSLPVYITTDPTTGPGALNANEFCYQSSSRDSKKNIVDYQANLSDILKVQPRIYTYKKTEDEDTGLIGEELAEIPSFAYAVIRNSKGVQSIDYGKLTVGLISIIQQQQLLINKILNKLNL